MSTTLVPPIFYEVSSRVRPARLYRTLAGAAVAIAECAPERAVVCVVQGSRRRRLSQLEAEELASRFARVGWSPPTRMPSDNEPAVREVGAGVSRLRVGQVDGQR